MKIEQVYKENKEGFTIEVNRQGEVKLNNSKAGYFVSITDNKINIKDLDSEFIKLLKLGNILNLETFYIGFWNGYLDLTLKLKSMSLAIKLAKEFNQQAIYNCYTQEVMEVQK